MRVVISAGGTGGHIYPALAIINKIKDLEPNSEFLYIGTTDRMEKDLIPELGIPYVGIPMTGLNRKHLIDNVRVFRMYRKAIKQAKKEIIKFNPDVVIGVGGYITAPVILAAHKAGYKTIIHEQNSIPGVSNKRTPALVLSHVKLVVTPGLLPTLATFLPANLFINVDLPTFGIPTTNACISFGFNPLDALLLFNSSVISLVATNTFL